jgi:hypothetical protein
MHAGTGLRLTVITHALEEFCARVRKQARKPGDALHALTAVQSLLSQFAPAGLNTSDALPLRECLDRHLEAARSDLINQHSIAILDALRAGQIEVIAACYTQLSRSGFRQAVELGAARVDELDILQMSSWLKGWIDQTRVRAAGAYPDSFDYAAAGIEPATLLAAEDLYVALIER